ncbi:MAG: Ig-like domain repeat protein, partial [Mycobacteriales bacterium]
MARTPKARTPMARTPMAQPPFDSNDYRKRVLAAVDARGGPQASDPFECYDLPLEHAEQLEDAVIGAQVDAVWAFWQKSRDHPKYRGLVTALLSAHDQVAPLLRSRDSRGYLAEDARRSRALREQGRSAELDAAIERLVERFGGLPRGKLDGLRRLAAAAGLDGPGTESRLSRHRLLDDVAAAGTAAVPAAVYRQVRGDLDELGRLLGDTPPASLYDLIGLPPGASAQEVRAEREVAAARNRELRPDRRRALVDDLLAAVTTLLVEGDPEAYLDSVAEDVTTRLRPRVAAAILVEDELTVEDHGHLLAVAEAAGLDRVRAVRVLATLAREAGVRAPQVATAVPPTAAPPAGGRPTAGTATGG